MPHSPATSHLTIAIALAGVFFVSPVAIAQTGGTQDGGAAAQQEAPAQDQATTPAESATQDEGAADAEAASEGNVRVIARLGDREFTNRDVAVAAEDLSDTLTQLPADQREAYLLTYLADLERIADAAREANVQDDPAYQSRLQYMQDRTLMETYLQRVGDEAATDEAARKFYEENIAAGEPTMEVKASHILVPTEEEATSIKQQLDEGGDFAELAKEHSKDPGSSQQGGDLGYFTKDQMVPEFAETAFELEPGAVSEPVESQFGWHVIKVEDKREQEKPALEAVEGQVKQTLARQAQRDLIMSLREQSQIEVVGQEGGAAGAAPAGETPAGGTPAGDGTTPEAPSDAAPSGDAAPAAEGEGTQSQ